MMPEAGNFYIQEKANCTTNDIKKNKNSIEKYNTVIIIDNLFYKIESKYMYSQIEIIMDTFLLFIDYIYKSI